jgi:hypothetical protein
MERGGVLRVAANAGDDEDVRLRGAGLGGEGAAERREED